MSQKEKIILLLSSLFCGFPLIFFSLKNHQNQKNSPIVVIQQKKKVKKEEEKEKNNLLSLKKKKSTVISNKNKKNKSSSFIFLIVLIIVVFVVFVIIILAIYQYLKNPKKNDDQDDASENDNWIEDYYRQKSSMHCYLRCNKNEYFEIILGDNFKFDELNKIVVEADIEELAKLSIDKFLQLNTKIDLENILQKITDYLTTYLTGQLLIDVYQERKKTKADYGILTKMATNMIKPKYDDDNILYTQFLPSKKYSEKVTNEDLEIIKDHNPLWVFADIIRRDSATFVEYKTTDHQDETCFLFPHFFTLYKLFQNIHEKIVIFFYDQIKKNNAECEKYKTLLKKLQDSEKSIDEPIKKYQKIYNKAIKLIKNNKI